MHSCTIVGKLGATMFVRQFYNSDPSTPLTRSEKAITGIALGVGVAALITGVGLLLAAHNILPGGLNAISDIGVMREVLAYGLLLVATAAIIAGIAKVAIEAKARLKDAESSSSETESSSDSEDTPILPRDLPDTFTIYPSVLVAHESQVRSENTLYFVQSSPCNPISILHMNSRNIFDLFPFPVQIDGENFVIDAPLNEFSHADQLEDVSVEQTSESYSRYTTNDFISVLRLFQDHSGLDHFYLIETDGSAIRVPPKN